MNELLAVVGVDERQKVACQAAGCGRGVYRRIHVVREADGKLGVYGSDCFARLFSDLSPRPPRYGGGEGRELTPAERQLLAENTDRLIAQFEAEHQVLLEQARLRQNQYDKVAQAAREREAQRRAEADRRRPLTDADLAPVLQEAKAAVRAKYGDSIDPDAPGWRGLVRQEAAKLLGR